MALGGVEAELCCWIEIGVSGQRSGMEQRKDDSKR